MLRCGVASQAGCGEFLRQAEQRLIVLHAGWRTAPVKPTMGLRQGASWRQLVCRWVMEDVVDAARAECTRSGRGAHLDEQALPRGRAPLVRRRRHLLWQRGGPRGAPERLGGREPRGSLRLCASRRHVRSAKQQGMRRRGSTPYKIGRVMEKSLVCGLFHGPFAPCRPVMRPDTRDVWTYQSRTAKLVGGCIASVMQPARSPQPCSQPQRTVPCAGEKKHGSVLRSSCAESASTTC